MTENPQPDRSSSTEMEVIRVGFLQVPRDQLFPVLLVFVVLVSGVGVVIATRETTQLLGLVAIIVGLGGGAFLYQNAQNWLKYGAQEASRKFTMTLLVLSADGRPVPGASVTIVGPVPFTDKKTNKDGRVIYPYTGRDANNYRNREVTITATHAGAAASVSEKLLSQDGQYIELRLIPSPAAGLPPSVPVVAPPVPSDTTPGDSSSMTMNVDLFQRIVIFVTPHVTLESSRTALINRAFFGEGIVGQLDTSGPAADFANHLITQLHTKVGVEMIIRLLSELRKDVGVSKQREIDTLIAELQAP